MDEVRIRWTFIKRTYRQIDREREAKERSLLRDIDWAN